MRQRILSLEQQTIFYLGRLGVPFSRGLTYLRYSLPLCLMEQGRPGGELWERTAARFGGKPANVRDCIHRAIKRAWEGKTEFWLEVFGERERCPTILEFYQMAADWTARYEFISVNAGRPFDEIRMIPKVVPSTPDEAVE